MADSNLDAKETVNTAKQVVMNVKNFTNDTIRFLRENSNVSEENIEWLNKNHDVTLYGGTEMGNTLVKRGVSEIDHHLDQLNRAVAINDKGWISLASYQLNEAIDLTKGYTSEYDFISISPENAAPSWWEISQTSDDPEIVDAATYMDDVENSLIESGDYTQNQYFLVENTLANASEINYLNNNEEELSQAIDSILKNGELDVENVTRIDDIKNDIGVNELFKDSEERQEDLGEVINDLRSKINEQQKLLKKLEKAYANQSQTTHKSILSKSAPMLSQIKTDIVNFGTDVCGKLAGQLSKAYTAAAESYEAANKASKELTNNLERAYFRKCELFSLGGISRDLERMEYEVEAKKFDAKWADKKMPIKTKLVAKFLNEIPYSSEELKRDVWKDGISPIDVTKDKIKSIPDKIKEAKAGIKDFVKNDIKQAKEDFTYIKNSISKEVYKTCAAVVEDYADSVTKNADRIQKKMLKYQQVDKTYHDAMQDIKKSIHSLTAITPFKKAEYTKLSDEMQQRADALNSYNSLSDIKDIGAYAKELSAVNEAQVNVDVDNIVNKVKTGLDNSDIAASNVAKKFGKLYYTGAEAIFQKKIDNVGEKFNKSALKLATLQDIISTAHDIANEFNDRADNLSKENDALLAKDGDTMSMDMEDGPELD